MLIHGLESNLDLKFLAIISHPFGFYNFKIKKNDSNAKCTSRCAKLVAKEIQIQLLAITGNLLYVTTSRPDVMHVVGLVGRF